MISLRYIARRVIRPGLLGVSLLLAQPIGLAVSQSESNTLPVQFFDVFRGDQGECSTRLLQDFVTVLNGYYEGEANEDGRWIINYDQGTEYFDHRGTISKTVRDLQNDVNREFENSQMNEQCDLPVMLASVPIFARVIGLGEGEAWTGTLEDAIDQLLNDDLRASPRPPSPESSRVVVDLAIPKHSPDDGTGQAAESGAPPVEPSESTLAHGQGGSEDIGKALERMEKRLSINIYDATGTSFAGMVFVLMISLAMAIALFYLFRTRTLVGRIYERINAIGQTQDAVKNQLYENAKQFYWLSQELRNLQRQNLDLKHSADELRDPGGHVSHDLSRGAVRRADNGDDHHSMASRASSEPSRDGLDHVQGQSALYHQRSFKDKLIEEYNRFAQCGSFGESFKQQYQPRTIDQLGEQNGAVGRFLEGIPGSSIWLISDRDQPNVHYLLPSEKVFVSISRYVGEGRSARKYFGPAFDVRVEEGSPFRIEEPACFYPAGVERLTRGVFILGRETDEAL